MKPVRYAYSVTTALLLGGAALTLTTGYPAGAQVAQNDETHMNRVVPRAGAPASFAELTAQLQPAVVNIATRQRVQVQQNPLAQLFGQQQAPSSREAQSLGSGFIISADGYVVTNNHVITAGGQGEVEAITVTTSDGTEFPAELVGKDADSDLAVLKIGRREAFPFVKFGDSRQSRVGDWVVAIGQPFGLGGTVTAGIVSAVYRNTGQGGAYDRYIQTDASINRGNSGGPLFDLQGNVIGINNAIFSPSGGSVGIGFAIPAETAQPIVQQLVRGETVERGYLGVGISPVTEDLAASLGLPRNRGEFIQTVEPNGPAARAGIRAGDVVVQVNNQEVTPDQTLSFLVANVSPGQTIPVELLRNGNRQTVRVQVAQRPTADELARSRFDAPDDQETPGQGSDTSATSTNALGLAVQALTPQIARQVGAGDGTTGLVIAGVDPSSDAAHKGLRRGDIVLSANYAKVTEPQALDRVIAEARQSNREAVLLLVQRRGQPATYLPVRLR